MEQSPEISQEVTSGEKPEEKISWKNKIIDNLRQEIINRGLNPENLPSSQELVKAGHSDLAHAISTYFGGFSAVREVFGGEVKQKNWRNITIDKLRQEIINRGLNPENLPSSQELKEAGHSDLVHAISRYFGGLTAVRGTLSGESKQKNWQNITIDELRQEIIKRGLNPENLPSPRELRGEHTDLVRAISKYFGGFSSVREVFGGEVKRKNWQNITIDELRQEIIKRGLNPENLPSSMELEEAGHSDLVQAISRYFGGLLMFRKQETNNDSEETNENIDEQKKQACEDFFAEVSEGKTLEAKEFKQLLGLFGSNHLFDILYKYRPDFRRVDPNYVTGTMAKYLGDFLIIRSNFKINDLDISLQYLSNRNFQDTLFEVIKESCLSHYHERKIHNKDGDDEECISEHLGLIKEKANQLHHLDLTTVIDRVGQYYQSILHDFHKPDKLVSVLREGGRPFPDFYQILNIKEIKDKKTMLIGDEMGMGKSASAILSKEYLGLKSALIIVPANVVDTWKNYLSDNVSETGEQIGYFKPDMKPRVLVVEGIDSLRNINPSDFDYVLISQEKMSEQYAEKLKDFDYDMLIIDEVHKLKNLTTGVRSQNVLGLTEKIEREDKYLVLLSGTPVPNKIKDVAMILKLLYPDQFKKIKNAQLVQNIINGDLVDIRNLLVPRMQMKALRESIEMPELTKKVLVTELSQMEKDIYEVLLEDDELTASEKIRAFRKFVMNPTSLEIAPDLEGSKIHNVSKHLNEVFQHKDRVVMFVNSYVEGMIRGENTILEKLHLPSDIEIKIIEGEVTSGERQKIQQELKDVKGKILLVISGGTADVGVDFSAGQYVLVYNEPWTEYDKRQQIARVYRPGLKGDLEVMTSITQGTIEQGISEYIKIKFDAIQKLLKGVPITDIEKEILKQAERSNTLDVEGDARLASEWLNSPQNRLHRFFGVIKEIGEENFIRFLMEHGEEYAECYLGMMSRGFQANTGRIAGNLMNKFVKEKKQKAGDLHILDIASGPEMLKTHIGDEYKDHVLSIDINPFHFQHKGENRAVGSFLHLPIKEKSLDYANLSLALHYTNFITKRGEYERLKILQEMNRALKEGGRAIINLVYSLDFKDEEKFRNIAGILGFRVIEEYTGVVSSGANYKSHCIVLEKEKDADTDLKKLVHEIGKENFDGLRLQENEITLKNSRRIVHEFFIRGKKEAVVFNAEDQKIADEEYAILQEGEGLIHQYGSVKDIPSEEIIDRRFLKINNGRIYRLLKKSDKMGGFVIIR